MKGRIAFPAAVAVVAAAGVGLAFYVGSGSGSFTAHGNEIVCIDAPDVTDGTQVTVTDASGHVLGTGALATDGSAAATKVITAYDQIQVSLGSLGGVGSGMYAYTFAVTVPAGQARYGISVGGPNRGTLWFTETQMRSGPQVGLGC